MIESRQLAGIKNVTNRLPKSINHIVPDFFFFYIKNIPVPSTFIGRQRKGRGMHHQREMALLFFFFDVVVGFFFFFGDCASSTKHLKRSLSVHL